MDPNPPEIVVLSNPATDPLLSLKEENQTTSKSTCSSLPVPKQRKAPSIFYAKYPAVGGQHDVCIESDFSGNTGLPAEQRDNISIADSSKSDCSDESSISGASTLSDVSNASATQSKALSGDASNTSASDSRAFKKLVQTISFLKKWAARTETMDAKNEFLKKFKKPEDSTEDTEKDHQVIVRIRRRLWKKTTFFNPTGNALYWYKALP